MNGWPLQLLSVACLSLAAKMEEPLVPSLLDLQVFNFYILVNNINLNHHIYLILMKLISLG